MDTDRLPWSSLASRRYTASMSYPIEQKLVIAVASSALFDLSESDQKFPEQCPVEVVLLSRNSAITGKRVFNSIVRHGLNITRAAFLEGKSPYAYIPAFNASLFLSANEADVQEAIDYDHPAG